MGFWSALHRDLGPPELCQPVSSHAETGGRTRCQGPLGPAFFVCAELSVTVNDRNVPRPANAPSCNPRGLVPSPRSGAALLSGTPEGGASHPRPRPRPRRWARAGTLPAKAVLRKGSTQCVTTLVLARAASWSRADPAEEDGQDGVTRGSYRAAIVALGSFLVVQCLGYRASFK